MKDEAITGTLKIGDEWNAINIIAKSQAKPLKAVAELVENSLDAKARNVLIQRARSKGEIYLKIIDDGEGIRFGEDGKPDFNYVATHICDSMKKRLEAVQREGVHGEFGIGLLGFWSIGKELRMISRGEDGKMYEMVMKRGNRRYSVIRTRRDHLFSNSGTEVTVAGIHEGTRGTLTGEKIQRYLSAELRDRIRNTKARIRIIDKVARKTLEVQPRAFRGERIREIRRIPSGKEREVSVELYLNFPKEGEVFQVSICKDGTRVVEDILDLEEFNREPWTLNRLEGILDYPHLEVAPSSRTGIVPDANFSQFIKAVCSIEGKLVEIIEARRRTEEEKANREILKEVRKAVAEALGSLPTEDYVLFDIRKRHHGVGKEEEEGERVALETDEEPEGGPEKEPLLFPGPLERVVIIPGLCNLEINHTRTLRAKALDKEDTPILSGVAFTWRILEGPGRLIEEREDTAVFEAGEEKGITNIEAAGQQEERVARGVATVIIGGEKLPEDRGMGRARGLPVYETVHEPREGWRSRYSHSRNVIEVNSGHRDYIACKEKPSWFRRYIGKLYAKELVLLNFPETPASQLLERIVELLCWMERSL